MNDLAALGADRFKGIKCLILDVDGVLTAGGIEYTESGGEIKTFNVKDGAGIKYWHRVGYVSALLTGRSSGIVRRRAEELGISQVVMDAKDKAPGLEKILGKLGVKAEECAYVGDDLPDIPVMLRVGLPIAVADAVSEVKEIAAAVTLLPGGRGAVREVVESILKGQGLWDKILSRYLPDLAEPSAE